MLQRVHFAWEQRVREQTAKTTSGAEIRAFFLLNKLYFRRLLDNSAAGGLCVKTC